MTGRLAFEAVVSPLSKAALHHFRDQVFCPKLRKTKSKPLVPKNNQPSRRVTVGWWEGWGSSGVGEEGGGE